MFRDFFVWMAELLFKLNVGIPLLDSFWIIIWSSVFGLFITLPLLYVASSNNTKIFKYAPLIFLITFIPGLFFILGPPLIQLQMLTDCKPSFEVSVESEMSSTVLKLQECRYKQNFYGDFGEWKLKTVQ